MRDWEENKEKKNLSIYFIENNKKMFITNLFLIFNSIVKVSKTCEGTKKNILNLGTLANDKVM